MTALRQFVRPLAWTLALTGLYAGGALLIAMADGQTTTRASTTERIVTDRHTGLALYGFDPVAYFTEAGPREGAAEFEAAWGGVTWRFLSEGNRAAFLADPAVYEPRYGGHDPIAISDGAALVGHPSVWLIHEERLYVFHSDRNKTRFASEPARATAAANRRWPAVRATLAP